MKTTARVRTAAVGLVLGMILAAPAVAQEQFQIRVSREGVCDGQFHTAELYENHGPQDVLIVKSRLIIGPPAANGGGYIWRAPDGFVLAFTGFGGHSSDKDVTPAGTTVTVRPEGYLYVTYWCFGAHNFLLWTFVEYVAR